jgi:hypothetical protein
LRRRRDRDAAGLRHLSGALTLADAYWMSWE